MESASGPRLFVARRRSVSHLKVANFALRFHILVAASIPLIEALETLAKQEDDLVLKETIQDVSRRLVGGQSLSESLSHHEDIFPVRLRAMVKLGESTGSLHRSLEIAAEDLQKQAQMISKLKSSLTYPLVLSCIALIILGLMVVYFVPTMVDFTRSMQTEMSWPLKLISGVADVATDPLVLFGVSQVVLGLGGALVAWKKTENGRRTLDRLWLKIPVVEGIVRCVASIELTQGLASMLACGCPLVPSLNLLGSGFSNHILSEEIQEVGRAIAGQGVSLAEALKQSTEYDDRVIGLVACGEESGNLEGILPLLAAIYSEELDNRLEAFLALIEPAVLLILGGAIGGLTLLFFLPMTQLIKSL